jgi:hypothetical protein
MWQNLTNNFSVMLNGPRQEEALGLGLLVSALLLILLERVRYECGTDYVCKRGEKFATECVHLLGRMLGLLVLRVGGNGQHIVQVHGAQAPVVREDVEYHLTEFLDEFVALVRHRCHGLDLGRLSSRQYCALVLEKKINKNQLNVLAKKKITSLPIRRLNFEEPSRSRSVPAVCLYLTRNRRY